MNKVINKEVEYIDLGLKDYKETWDYQTVIFEDIVKSKIENRKLPDEDQKPTRNYLILCQHPHVYTLGKSGDPKNLLVDDAGLKSIDAVYYKINRGGDITYHGPGQLVGYPILDLENFYTDIHRYLRDLEESIIRTLLHFGIESKRYDGLTGVWIDPEKESARKICAMGVKSSRWVTMHGFALNVNSDLSYFNHIVPCGIDDKAVTSMEKELGKSVDIEEVSKVFSSAIQEVFGMNLLIK